MNKLYSASQEDLLQLGSTLSKMLKQRFGKGPETCFVTMHSDRLVIYVRNFITPAEEVLVEHHKMELAHTFRNAVMESVFKQFLEESSKVLGISFNSYYSDWNYDFNAGMLFIEDKLSEMPWEESRLMSGKIVEQIHSISAEAHKKPNKVSVIKINQHIFALKYEGITLQTEKILYQNGYSELLLQRSSDIKNIYLDNKGTFENYFAKEVTGIFITWDYERDQCYIFFYLH